MTGHAGDGAPPSPLDPTDLLQLAADQVSADLSGETVILSMRDGVYYGLDAVGSAVWRRLAEPTPFAAVVAAVVAEFDVEEDRAARDLTALVRDLEARGLAVIRPGARE
ncbi:MAG: PqqD family protein [Gemmatimonadota bacterium]|nr:PqqD family protein [Gemmatimonadota bacterium]